MGCRPYHLVFLLGTPGTPTGVDIYPPVLTQGTRGTPTGLDIYPPVLTQGTPGTPTVQDINGVVESLFNVTVYLRIKLQGYEYSTMLHTENMQRKKRRKKQTTSLCLSTYFNILIRVLLLIKTLICRLHTMFHTHRYGKKDRRHLPITYYVLHS